MSGSAETELLAFALAATGNLDDAERLIGNTPQEAMTTAEMDLLARISIVRGDDDRARTLWQGVLRREPANNGAAEALAELQGRWRISGRVRSAMRFAVPGVLLITLAIGGTAWLRYHRAMSVQSRQLERMARVIAALPPRLDAARFQIPGCSTTRQPNGDITILLPESGPTSAHLKAIGSSLSKCGAECQVIVETPEPAAVKPLAQPLDGFKRAIVLAQCLSDISTLPKWRFQVSASSFTNTTAIAVRIARNMPDLP